MAVHDSAEISEARDYYRTILPFYEKESVARAHLDFWRRLAVEQKPRRILEIGAGLGRITAELSRVAPAVGLDISLEMLAAARRRSRESASFVAADARRAAFSAAFDLIVAPGDPFSHMTSLGDRLRALRAVARQLAPGGAFVLEGLHRPRLRDGLSRRRIRHPEGTLLVEEAWFPLGVRDLWHARYRYRDEREDGTVRLQSAAFIARAWNTRAVRAFFASCGLEIVRLWGGFDRRPFRADASRLIVMARRLPGRGR